MDDVLPAVEEGLGSRKEFEGPVTTTFLLCLATPMVVVPVERMLKRELGRDGVGDDRRINEQFADSIKAILKERFGKAPFTQGVDWRLVRGVKPFNIAEWGGKEIFDALDQKSAAEAAASEMTGEVLCILRNALAHGGVAYLDKNGRQSEGQAAMFAFVSGKTKNHKVVSLDILRISEKDMRTFLAAWAGWLKKEGVSGQVGELVTVEEG